LEHAINWLKENNIVCDSLKNAIKEPFLVEAIEKEINLHNQKFGSWEQIKKIELTPDEWTIDDGHLTPTMKLKRKVVSEKYKDLIDQIYS
jgi:long-chain acyl-CoA synthetase